MDAVLLGRGSLSFCERVRAEYMASLDVELIPEARFLGVDTFGAPRRARRRCNGRPPRGVAQHRILMALAGIERGKLCLDTVALPCLPGLMASGGSDRVLLECAPWISDREGFGVRSKAAPWGEGDLWILHQYFRRAALTWLYMR